MILLTNIIYKYLNKYLLQQLVYVVSKLLYLLYRRVSPKIVRLGELDTDFDDDGAVDYNISTIINHPKYEREYKYFDIALLKLQTKVKMTQFIRPACLYNKAIIHQSQALATGWGATSYNSNTNSKLLKTSLEIYKNERCVKAYKTYPQLQNGIVDSMLCAGDLKGFNDTCQGDSGGPLLITEKGNYCKFFLIGITSFGKACAIENFPSVYTRVSAFVPWIEKIVW